MAGALSELCAGPPAGGCTQARPDRQRPAHIPSARHAAARALIWLGARAVIAEIDRERGQAAAARLVEEFGPGRAVFIHTDIADERSVERLAREAQRALRKVDTVLNSAAVGPARCWGRRAFAWHSAVSCGPPWPSSQRAGPGGALARQSRAPRRPAGPVGNADPRERGSAGRAPTDVYPAELFSLSRV